MQNMSPKVDAASFAPAAYPEDPEMEWWAAIWLRWVAR